MSKPFDINNAIREIFGPAYGAPLPPIPRFQRQQDIEQAITKFCPDFIEAVEILDALTASLERRYEQDIADILHEAKQLREALMEADATEEREHDEWTNRARVNDEQS